MKVMEAKRKDVSIDSLDELIEFITEFMEDPYNEGKKLKQICIETGIEGMNLLDNRTMQLLELYSFYKYAPHLVDKAIFMDAQIILSQYEPRLI